MQITNPPLGADRAKCAVNYLMATEPILDPDLPIIDAHHHLWLQSEAALAAMESSDTHYDRAFGPVFRRHARYLYDELLADLTSGHKIVATVYVEGGAMYRPSGPEAMRSVGEVEFANRVAEMAASGTFGQMQVCAGIVGGIDLRLGDAAEEVLIAHIQAGGGRYRGVRTSLVLYDEDSTILGPGIPHILLDSAFRRGFSLLRQFGLSYDAVLFEPQLPELIDLAYAFPDTSIVLDHVGIPLGVGRHVLHEDERFQIWRENIQALSRCANVTVKLGGLGMPFRTSQTVMPAASTTSLQLAEEWKPYIDSCIEAFGVQRCMFESNFPVDAGATGYPVLWNTFKRLASGASKSEKAALFHGTATRVYRLLHEVVRDRDPHPSGI